MDPRALVAWFVFASLGCASSGESTSWLDRQLAREADPLRPAAIESEDGIFSARPAARLTAPISEADGAYTAELDIGAESDAVCWIRNSEMNLATSVAAYAESVLAAVVDPSAVQVKRLSGLDAGAIGSAIFVAADWMYQAEQEGEQVAGLLKVRSANAYGGSAVCVHNELGFRDSFSRFFASLVSSLRFPSAPAPAPYYEEIHVISLGGRRAGVQKVSLTLDQDGDTRVDASSSMALPRDLASLLTIDSEGLEYSTPEGILINSYEAEMEGSELTTKLSLKPLEDGSWQVSGVFRSKPLEAAIESDGAVLSALGQTLELRRALREQGVGGSVSVSMWVPSVDPTQIVEATFEIGEALANGEHRLKATLGPMAIEGIVDAMGSPMVMEMDLGSQRMKMERVYLRGEY